ncbi:hypothetical protein ACM7V1_29330 [Pseudomonas aeruginosa]
MTNPISDDRLADLDELTAKLAGEDWWVDWDGSYTVTVSPSNIQSLIVRLRAAEADAKRYLHLRNSGMIAAGRVGRHSISIPHYDTTDAERKELDDFLDAAMERTP